MSLSMQCRLERGNFSLDVDLSIPSGRTIGIVGDNGSGKTTTLDMIAGLLPCTTGAIAIDGVTVDDSSSGTFVQPEQRGIASVFQGGALLPHLSVERNIVFGRGRELGSTRHFDDIIDAFDLRMLLAQRPHQLSGGQRQRVALARAFFSPSRVLLLDEPTTHLDVDSRRTCRHLMSNWLETYDGVAVLVSHDHAEIDELADSVHDVAVSRGVTPHATLSNAH